MIKQLFLGICLFMIIINSGFAQLQAKDSTAAVLGRELLTILNSGDKTTQLNFITRNLDEGALNKRGASDWLKDFTYLYDHT